MIKIQTENLFQQIEGLTQMFICGTRYGRKTDYTETENG